MDETGIWFGAGFKHKFMKKDNSESNRATDSADERSRITEMAALSATGETLPGYTIVKCTSNKADLTG